jgi:RNA polymerase sigma-70 factor (ECF subfamily)
VTTSDDDAALVRRCLDGDGQAQRALVERHRPAIWRLARNATGRPEEAFDIAQETFVAAFSALARYDASRPFGAWLMRIALNKCRDWSRRRAVRRLFEFGMPEGLEAGFPDDAAPPDRVAADRAELAAVARALAGLPARLKEVLLLRTVEGLSQAETAALLVISEKAVETRLVRARIKLSKVVGR